MENEKRVSLYTNEHSEESMKVSGSSTVIPLKQSINEKNQSDISDDETFQIMRFRTKPQTITDSDSEVVKTVEVAVEGDQCNEEVLSEAEQGEHLVSQVVERTKKKPKRLTILDSDSDVDDDIIVNHLNSDSNKMSKTTDHYRVNDMESKVHEKTSWAALCDSDSDEDNNQTSEEIQDNQDRLSEEEILKPTPYKKKNKRKTDENYTKTKMTGKEAAQQRREIQSESQRMVREMNVSLPYHRPKAFTLKEFLARRPKFSSAIPLSAGTSPSVAIKMSNQELEIISKKLKQHEKEVKEFYKSESESEDNEDINDQDYIPPGNKKNSDNQQTKLPEGNLTNDQVISDEHDKIDEIAQDSGIDIQEVVVDSPKEISDELVEKISDMPNGTNQGKIELSNKSEGLCAVDSNTESVPNYRDMEKIDQNLIEIQAESVKNVEQVNEKCNVIEDISVAIGIETVKEITTSEKLLDTQTVECSSMEYEFNLDDIEENSENIIPVEKEIQIENDEHLNSKSHNESYSCGELIGTISNNESKTIIPESVIADNNEKSNIEQSQILLDGPTINQPKRFEYTDLDREIENFGNIEKPIETEIPKLTKIDLIREKLANIRPRLSGGENEVIDLNREIARPNEVTKLMHRFVQHTTKVQGHKSKVKLNIVSVESGEIHKETVDMLVDEDDPMEIEEKPGAKLQKLRNELQNQMAIQRLQNWQKKVNPQSFAEDKDSYEVEKSDCEAEDAILDNDEEEEMSESSEEEIEEEQDDKQENEHQIKSAFLDDEADESDREDTEECNEADEHDRDEDTEECNEAEDGDDEDEIDEDEKTELHEDDKSKSPSLGEEVEQKHVKKNMKRIIKGFTEDSDEEEDRVDLASQRNVKANDNLNKSIEGQLTEDDDYLPPHQPPNLKTPVRQTTVSQSKSDFDFLTPVSYFTGLNNLNSASKSKNTAVVPPFQMPNMPSPLKELNWQANLQKKLFTDSEITSSQANAIAELCSDKTSFTQEIDNADGPRPTVTNLESELQCTAPVNTQDILNICSGEFADSQEGVSSSAPPTSQDLLNLCSGEFTGVSQICSAEVSQTPIETHTFSSTKEVKNLGVEEDLIISQLLDEEEMEKFKKKFDSPLMTNTQRRIVDEFEEVTASGGVIDSDEDDDEVLEVKKKVSQKKLTFSDESSDEEQEEETIDLHDEIEEEDEEDISPDNVAYDSEENEVEYINNKAKTSDFFDKEAELSESEWGSADEDEKDLDTMEFEQGDNEKFDEKKIRSDLEKIHMKRMLDDDTREVKLLQELLLEDGELHGTGRERKFRWKNIDSVDETDGRNKEDDDVGYLDEEESEEQWRKKRHEMEMFLKEKQLKSASTEDDDDLLKDTNSQLLKIGHKVIQNSFQESSPIEKPKAKPISPDIKSTFSFMSKRGSFLSRKDQVLQRLTDYNKQTNTSVNSAKNSRNFLFQTVAVGETISTIQEKKRKAADGTPKVIKKLRLSDNMSPAVSRKKTVDPPSAKAKLF